MLSNILRRANTSQFVSDPLFSWEKDYVFYRSTITNPLYKIISFFNSFPTPALSGRLSLRSPHIIHSSILTGKKNTQNLSNRMATKFQAFRIGPI